MNQLYQEVINSINRTSEKHPEYSMQKHLYGCLKQYYNNGELSNVSIEAKYNTIVNQVSAPTLQMAMKWLREVHSVIIIIDTNDRWLGVDNRFYWYRIYYGMGARTEKKWYNDPSKPTDILRYQTYEQACEEAIKDSLENLI